MKKNIKQRINYWDNMKGILILLVVFAHFLYQLKSDFLIGSITKYIYMFHMPVFIFISGFFGKSNNTDLKKYIIKYIYIYIIFNSLMFFAFDGKSLLEPMFSYWYLIALIVWRIITPYISKNKNSLIFFFFLGIIAGFYPSINNTFAVSRIICFYPYYLLGYMLSIDSSNKIINSNWFCKIRKAFLLLLITVPLGYICNFVFRYSFDSLMMFSYSIVFDCYGRMFLYVIGCLAIYIFTLLTIDKKIPFITLFGRNSLSIFVFHRFFTLIGSIFLNDISNIYAILLSLVMSFIICLLFGNDYFSKLFGKFIDDGVLLFTTNKRIIVSKLVLTSIFLCFVFNVIYQCRTVESNNSYSYPSIMESTQQEQYDNAFKITFTGDLILLEDQVKRGYKDGNYNYDDVFMNTKKYISSADLAIGVLEGPLAGGDVGYSVGNFDDGKDLYLNFPDSFAYSIKDAGFDLVTTANNHLFDKGKKGAIRTLDILDSIGLEHTGSYRNKKEKKLNHIKIMDVNGFRFAILSYTYGSNYIDDDELINGKYSSMTSVISGTKGSNFNKLKKNVEKDFIEAKTYSPDFIIVLPHIGTQFSNEIDDEQRVWFNIFKENGADIILGDHSHTVQPVMIEKYKNKNVFELYSPGNFSNIYRDNQGDTSVITNIYIDRASKKIIGGSVIPLYTYSYIDGNYHAVSIYDSLTDSSIRNTLSTDDFDRIKKSNNIITSILFNSEIDLSNVTDTYYFDNNEFFRNKVSGVSLTDEMKSGILYNSIEENDSICFIGDSITEGTRNGGVPWYEPIEELFLNKKFLNYSKGSSTISYMLENVSDIPKADLYVIAIGVNDIRYRDKKICALDSKTYIDRVDSLKKEILKKNKKSDFIFISPWYSLDGDVNSKISYDDKMSLTNEYSNSLKEYCYKNNIKYINPNIYLENHFKNYPDNLYLVDAIHPNSTDGVILYSEAVLSQ